MKNVRHPSTDSVQIQIFLIRDKIEGEADTETSTGEAPEQYHIQELT